MRRCALGEIAPGSSVTVSFASAVAEVAPFSASVTAIPTPSGGIGTFASYPVFIVHPDDPLLTDVRLSLTGPSEIPFTTLGRYTATARNEDSVTAVGLVLIGQVSNDDRLVRAELAGVQCLRDRGSPPAVVDCVAGELAPGAQIQMNVDTVNAVSPSGGSTLTLSLRQGWKSTTVLRARELELNARIGPEPPVAPGPQGGPNNELALTVSHNGAAVPVGGQFTWTDTIVNRGAGASGPIRLIAGGHGLPTIVEHTHAECSMSVTTTHCDLPSLPARGSVSLTFTGYVFHPAGGPVVLTDSVRSGTSSATVNWALGTFDPTAQPADLEIVPVAQHAIAPTGSTPAVGATNANSVTSWRITNLGPGRATQILVTDQIEPASTSQEDSPGCESAWCVRQVLDPGESTDVTFATAGPDAAVHHRVRVFHASPDPVSSNDTASAVAPAQVGGGGSTGGGGGGNSGGGGGSATPAPAIPVTTPSNPLPPAAVPTAVSRPAITGSAGPNRLFGTGLNDVIRGLGGNDRIYGRGGSDALFGDAGNDLLDGGTGLDRIFGGSGADTVAARDGKRDSIDCGAGRDRAIVDRIDTVRRCEIVVRR